MSDRVVLVKDHNLNNSILTDDNLIGQGEGKFPSITKLESNLEESSKLVQDIVLKNYLHKLKDLEVVPLPNEFKDINKLRIFEINEMVYQKDEYSTYKFASVFSSLQSLDCGVFIIVNSNGEKTDFYMGVRSKDNNRTTKSLKDTLKNALIGHFPGVKVKDMLDPEVEDFLSEISKNNVSSVSCIANNKDEDFKNNDNFIQGLEKLALAMQGKKYTAIVLANSINNSQISDVRSAYETIYTQISPFANMQLSYGTNTALSISDALSKGATTGSSYSKNIGTSRGTSTSSGDTYSESTSKPDILSSGLKIAGATILGAAAIATAPLTGGASLAAAGAILAGQSIVNSIPMVTKTKGRSHSKNKSQSVTSNEGETFGENSSTSENATHTIGETIGKTENMQLTMQNKTLLNTLEKIDCQLQRLNECESLGMWECAAYFMSDSLETVEMAAGTYKALMKGSKSGVETSAINTWGWYEKNKIPILCEYITNFIHPIFAYPTDGEFIPVTPASMVSSNELAIQMGLPRKSVCGFPVVEHAEFGKEVVSNLDIKSSRTIPIGNIFSMGSETKTPVKLSIDSLTMHTFVTGSTGSGKSNTLYEILYQLHNFNNVPFLVIEPAKGEYKNIFGNSHNVSVYGTNAKKTEVLKINPFSFPDDIHVLEHLDRLVEIFNVCWPMYAAMPAILKEAIEKAYISVGWDLIDSINVNGNIFPNFTDVLEQIEIVINESQYSKDCKGDYSGALTTRIRSMTTGLNRLIFTQNEISNSDLFDKSVIVDLSRVGSTEEKALIMGVLVMKLNEYRMTSGKINSSLSHITVLEEAHNLLKRTSTEQSSESSNLLGKSVEMLSNSIAEMRTYGEGFIIADQAPGLLDMSVIRNTNTKIILRLPEKSDRELVGYAACLKDNQLDEISKLYRALR